MNNIKEQLVINKLQDIKTPTPSKVDLASKSPNLV